MKRLLFVSVTLFLFSFQSAKAQSTTMVDLGLSVKWATCNLGAASPEAAGDFYGWGDTMTKTEFSWESLSIKWHEKYTSDDHLAQLQISDDAANKQLGDKWRIPTKEEYEELIANCSFKWTKRNGVNGALLTSKKNGKSIFFPEVPTKGRNAAYWSSSVSIQYDRSQYAWFFSEGNEFWGPSVKPGDRYYGNVIRPVYDSRLTPVSNGSQSLAQHTNTQRVAVNSKTMIWATPAGNEVFKLYSDGTADVKMDVSYRTKWEQDDDEFIFIGGTGTVKQWMLDSSTGSVFAVYKSSVTQKPVAKLVRKQ